MTKMYKVAIIGAGNMGCAIAKGLCGGDYEVCVSNPHSSKLEKLKSECPDIITCLDNSDAIVGANLIVLAVKPYIMPCVIREIKDAIDYDRTVIASLAAPLSLQDLTDLFAEGSDMANCSPKLIKVIPNTAISVKQSMTFISTMNIEDDVLAVPLKIFGEMGDVDVISERLMPAVTALCSCGIAYAMRYVRAAVEGAVELGIRPADALRYEIETLKGACAILTDTNSHPEAEIDRVTTPGGITIKGLNAMERYGFTTAVIEGLKASNV